jgi:hypothetical protein
MCRFQYQQVWSFLKEFEIAIRIDEDCLIESFPKIEGSTLMTVGYICNETHEITNRTLLSELDKLGLGHFMDGEYPYTNLFVTQVQFWLRKDVQALLNHLGEHPDSLANRWGDLPILGVALKAYGGWDSVKAVNKSLSYLHLSHSTRIHEGRYQERVDWLSQFFNSIGNVRKSIKSYVS